MNAVAAEVLNTKEPEEMAQDYSNAIDLTQFIAEFGDDLINAVSRQNPPIYDGNPSIHRRAVMQRLLRKPFPAQQEVVQAVTRLLVDNGGQSAVINAEMGSGKTMMAISTAAVLHHEGYRRTLVISPPHLVYKWRREILQTVPNARVWVLNGPDTLRKLLKLRALLDQAPSINDGQEFFVMGRVRMRMGFHWRPAVTVRKIHRRHYTEVGNELSASFVQSIKVAACPRCGAPVTGDEGFVSIDGFAEFAGDRRSVCDQCKEPLWTLMRPSQPKDRQTVVKEALCQIPTIGPKTAQRLLQSFGDELLLSMLADNVYEFVNLMDNDGELVFSDSQAKRIERALGTTEFAVGQGGYQPTEFVKRYLPQGYFDLLIVDEGHEYKNEASAQGQAMGVLAAKARKVLLLTGTLMGGYADDLFYLLWRIMPRQMIEDGYARNRRASLGPACMGFLREHGILIDVYKETDEGSHKTSKGKKVAIHTKKGPGFGPKGIARYVLPYTVFLKLKDIGGNILPAYTEHYVEVGMACEQKARYEALETNLKGELKRALRRGDTSLLGVVLNVLLAWPDCCFREEVVKHPRTRELLAFVPTVFSEDEASPKESRMLELCRAEKARGRRVLIYTTYTGKRDTSARLKTLLTQAGFKASVLRSVVDTSKREDWILDQVERGVDVLITNPELVKTGLDLLDFPTIVFIQTGFNVYTLQQAARRSWRIGQQQPVDVYFLGYERSAQTTCLTLMAQKIAVAQSTSGDMPDTGLDVLNQDSESIEIALAKQLAA
jgi:hypothetical protein